MNSATRTAHNKLVRDNIPMALIEKDKLFKAKTITGDEYRQALLQKLFEEANELKTACNEYESARQEPYVYVSTDLDDFRSNLIEEAADIMEVLQAIYADFQIKPQEVMDKQAEKRKARGGFSKGIFLEWVEDPLVK